MACRTGAIKRVPDQYAWFLVRGNKAAQGLVGFQKSSSDRWRENEFMTRLKIRLIFEKKTKKGPAWPQIPHGSRKGISLCSLLLLSIAGRGEKLFPVRMVV